VNRCMYCIFVATLLSSCQKSSPELMIGTYVGWFKKTDSAARAAARDNKINITIEAVERNTMRGRSIVAGNERPFTGTFTAQGEYFQVDAAEPGDDRYDGSFSFLVKPAEGILIGSWIPNKPTATVTRTEYTLNRTEFTYNPDRDLPRSLNWSALYNEDASRLHDIDFGGELLTEDVSRFNASKVLLKKEDVENMHKGDLEVLRNSIYARHGYSFKRRKMRYVFDQIDWYVPVATDVRDQLTDLEQKNIALIKRYEEHAAAYYDSFGR